MRATIPHYSRYAGYYAIPTYPLYDQQAVAGATFLGSPVAGSILLALNYRRLGRTGAAAMAITLGALATIVLMFIGFSLPSKAPRAIVAALPMLLMMMLAKKLQGPAVEAHKKAGGPPCPRLKAAGIGLACLAVVVGIAAAVYFAQIARLGTKVTIGTKDEIYYSHDATREQTLALGEALKTERYFSDKDAYRDALEDGRRNDARPGCRRRDMGRRKES